MNKLPHMEHQRRGSTEGNRYPKETPICADRGGRVQDGRRSPACHARRSPKCSGIRRRAAPGPLIDCAPSAPCKPWRSSIGNRTGQISQLGTKAKDDADICLLTQAVCREVVALSKARRGPLDPFIDHPPSCHLRRSRPSGGGGQVIVWPKVKERLRATAAL